jgi:hypothetical protein
MPINEGADGVDFARDFSAPSQGYVSMTLVAGAPSVPLVGEPANLPTERKPRSSRFETYCVLVVSFAVYFTISMLLDFKYLSFQGDAVARMANGFYILHSRDPHLAAVGFVWNPLSSFSVLPLLAFNSLWPVLASHNVAGTTVSALAMTGAVYQLYSLLREWGVSAAPRLVLTAFFAFNPMVLYFGGNGMSEALYLFCMIAAARYFSRWLKDDDLPSLVYSAIALGIGYLERSEPIAAAACVTPVVLWVTYVRTPGERRYRIWAGLTDVTVLLLPIVTSFVGWAVVSYVITGQPFQQFQSKYGNATLIANAHEPTVTLHARLVHEAKAITYMSPLLIVIVLAALVLAVVRRNIGIVGVVAVLGGGLGFTLLSYLANAIFPWYRYYIMVAPIEVLLVGSLFAKPVRLNKPAEQRIPTQDRHRRITTGMVFASIGAVVVSVVLLGPSVPSTAIAMTNYNMAPDVVGYTGFIFTSHPDALERSAKYEYAQIRSVSNYLDAQHFTNGDVAVDTANSCIPNVDTNVSNPRMFVIHNDRDFERVIADPLVFHTHYLLVGFAGQDDAILALYPNLGQGTPWVKLVHTFRYPSHGFCDGFRLFKVIGYPT